MKSIWNKLVGFMVLAVVFTACHDDDNIVTVQGTQDPLALAIDTDQILLEAINADNPAITLTWNTAEYSQPSQVNYEVQLSNSDSFDEYIVAGSVTASNAISWNVETLNSALGQAGFEAFNWADAYFRVVSSIGTQAGEQQTSNAVSVSVYPYFAYPFTDYFLVGAATEPGWSNNNNNPPLFRAVDNPDLYYYTGYFNADAFKVLEILGQWQPQWGTNDGATLDVNPGGGSDPDVFNVPGAAGYYTFAFNRGGLVEVNGEDLGPNTFTIYAEADPGMAAVTSLELTGSGLDGAGTMTQSTFDPFKWYINSVHLVPGDIEFMANGADMWGSTQELGGIATLGGGAIPVPVEDDYDVWFDAMTGRYIFIPLNF